jgi:hypothetical protein
MLTTFCRAAMPPCSQLDKGRRRRFAGLAGLLKNAELSAPGGGRFGRLGAMPHSGLAAGGRGGRLGRAEPAQDFFDHLANKLFVDCG